MSDESQVSAQEEVLPAAPVTPPDSGGKVKAFFATTGGRVLLIVLAVTALLTVLGIVSVIALGALGMSLWGQAVDQVPVVAPSTTPPATVATPTVAPAVAVVPNEDVFTPRDPFTQIIIPADQLGFGVDTSADDANTLTLIEIVTDNGIRKAVLTLGSTTYTQAAGERLGDTPWQVVSIGNANVVMLYGDSQMTLTVGQGVVTK
jgi:hypothetical protein